MHLDKIMKNSSDKYYQLAKNELDKINTSVQDTRLRKYDFWKHTTLIIVTIIGFSVALFSISTKTPNIFILISLGLMLVDVLLGLLILREDIDINQHQGFVNNIFSYNNWIILDKVQNGELNAQSEEHKGLFIANLIEGFKDNPSFNKDKEFFNQYSYNLAEKYKDKLPFQQFLKETGGRNRWKDPVQKVVVKHFELLVNSYYLILFVSLVLFFFGLLMGLI